MLIRFSQQCVVSATSGDTLKQYHQYLIFSHSQDLAKIAFAFTAGVKELESVKGLFFTLSIPLSPS